MKELKFNYIAFFLCLTALFILQYQCVGVEGGLDSWQHFLISKYAIKHPHLFLDQWNKPVFTLVSTWFCQDDMDSLVNFNLLCVSLGALFISFAAHEKGYRNSWVLIPFTIFMPELFLNTISGLTEPLALMMVSLIIWSWSIGNYRTSVIIASFLPFARTEGFVLLGALFILIVYEKKYKVMPWMLFGSVFMNILGYIITDKPFWIITENPYWGFEMNGTFDPGKGSILHFVNLARPMFGIVLIVLGLVSLVIIPLDLLRRKKVDGIFVFALSAFVLYFLAHTLIYYFGVLGSHGLTRPMALLAPFMALLAYYPVNRLLSSAGHVYRQIIFSSLALSIAMVAYAETHFPLPFQLDKTAIPFDRSQINFVKAGNWLRDKRLMDRVIIHQSPFFNCIFHKDPYDPKSTYYVWSIDKQNDWSNDGSIVIWDGYSAVREGGMPLEWLAKNPRFKEILFIEGETKPEDDPTRFDIHIFEKIPYSSDAK